METQIIDGLNATFLGIDTGFDDLDDGHLAQEVDPAGDDELEALISDLERGWLN